MEAKLLVTALADRAAFEQLRAYNVRNDLSEKALIIWDILEEQYDKDEETDKLDKETVEATIARKYPKYVDSFKIILQETPASSTTNLLDELLKSKLDSVSSKLISSLAAKDPAMRVAPIIEEYQQLQEGKIKQDEEEHTYIYMPPTELVRGVTGENLITVSPPALNESIGGGITRQGHICIFARPETGKSTLALSMSVGFLRQRLKVMYVGNEDPTKVMLLRLIQGILHVTKEEIIEDPETIELALEETNYNNFIFLELSPGTPYEIEGAVKRHQPDILIADQIYNLDMGAEGKTESLSRASSFMRKMAKKNNLVSISVTQAGDSASNKVHLEMNDIDYANTGVQANVDVLIGMGVNEQLEQRGLRMLSFPKNKLGVKRPISVQLDAAYVEVI